MILGTGDKAGKLTDRIITTLEELISSWKETDS